MIDYIVKRYGAWISRGLLLENNGVARVTWPGRGDYQSEIVVYVGPDTFRYIWCRPPAGKLEGPSDLRVSGVQIQGILSDGRGIVAENCSTGYLTATIDTSGYSAWIVLHIENCELSLTSHQLVAGPCRVEWTLTNALFMGVGLSGDLAAGHPVRRDRFQFSSEKRTWTLCLLPEFTNTDKDYLSNGVAQSLPTATLCTDLPDLDTVYDADEEVYIISRLLSLASGASVGGMVRRVSQADELIIESFIEWSSFGSAVHYQDHALITNEFPIADALSEYLGACIRNYRELEPILSLSAVIGLLEQARSNQIAEVRIALAILAIETLTYKISREDGISEQQASKSSIEDKLNRLRNAQRTRFHMPFIDKKFSGEARGLIRNPLMHTGQIAGLSAGEKDRWYNELYSLAFKMLIFLLGYSGNWLVVRHAQSTG